jgi:UDP-N-acetylglucosamine acyltransferase
MNDIHPGAIVAADAELGHGNVIGPGAVIGAGTRLGSGNWIGAGATIGAPPEIRGYPHPPDWIDQPGEFGVTIGDGNTIRERVGITAGSRRPTAIGDRCFLMTGALLAHDVRLEDNVTVSIGVMLCGHVRVGAGAGVGAGAAVHQFRIIGPGAMIGMGAAVTRDIPPYAKAYGNPARVHGANTVGMSRGGLDEELAAALDAHYAAGASAPEVPPAALAAAFAWWREATGKT